MGRSAAFTWSAEVVRALDHSRAGLPALDKRESKRAANLRLLYARGPARTAAARRYVARVRAREQTKPDEDQAMGAVMKAAVDKMPALQQQRLRELFEKAIAAGLGRP